MTESNICFEKVNLALQRLVGCTLEGFSFQTLEFALYFGPGTFLDIRGREGERYSRSLRSSYECTLKLGLAQYSRQELLGLSISEQESRVEELCKCISDQQVLEVALEQIGTLNLRMSDNCHFECLSSSVKTEDYSWHYIDREFDESAGVNVTTFYSNDGPGQFYSRRTKR